MKKNDLIKYINGSLSEAEQKEVLGWIEKNESNRRYFHSLKESYILMTLPKDPVSGQDYAEFLRKYPSVKNGTKRRRLRAVHYIAAAAAAVAIFLTIGLTPHLYNRDTRDHCIANDTKKLLFSKLPDGSTIALAPDTKIYYRKEFGKTHRKIYFTGTCYFNVAKNQEIPFKVKPAGRNIIIEVTGTRFYAATICDSTRNEQFELSLAEGSVNVKTCSRNSKELISMVAGEHLEINKDYSSEKTTISEHQWNLMDEMVQYLDFKDAKLSDIVKRVENVYNCKIRIHNSEIAQHLLTANFYNNSLEDILTIFEVTMNITSRVNNEGVIELY